ncbi:MAG: MFS transporter [Pseudomonadales bacterium]|nr:MFS transporter [Pseudomonadales bacterium]
MFTRNVLLLFLAQVVFVSGSVLTVTIGGIVGSRLAPTAALATLPVSLMVVGTALTTVPATLLMQRFGRRIGFAGAAGLAMGAALLAAGALDRGSFGLFCAATAGVGASLAFSQQFRFAAAESVAPERAGQAISFILLGSIGGALLGPELAARGQLLVPELPFRGAALALAGLFAVAAAILLALGPTRRIDAATDARPPRPLGEMVRSPLFLVAVAGGVVGQGVMTFVMTATPVSMHVMDGHSMADTAGVIRAHVIGMYLPSLASAALIARFGPIRLMVVGVGAMLATLAIGFSGQAVLHYWWALVLLGIGWNFLFVGGTTLLVRTYRPSERFRAQAVNEASVFGVSALASLLAGTLMAELGWTRLLIVALPFVLAMGVALLLHLRRPVPAAA